LVALALAAKERKTKNKFDPTQHVGLRQASDDQKKHLTV
jgi:hypothetical protein